EATIPAATSWARLERRINRQQARRAIQHERYAPLITIWSRGVDARKPARNRNGQLAKRTQPAEPGERKSSGKSSAAKEIWTASISRSAKRSIGCGNSSERGT